MITLNKLNRDPHKLLNEFKQSLDAARDMCDFRLSDVEIKQVLDRSQIKIPSDALPLFATHVRKIQDFQELELSESLGTLPIASRATLCNHLYLKSIATHEEGIKKYNQRFLDLQNKSDQLTQLNLSPSDHAQLIKDIAIAQRVFQEDLPLKVIAQLTQIKSTFDDAKEDWKNCFNSLIYFHATNRKALAAPNGRKIEAHLDTAFQSLQESYRECLDIVREFNDFKSTIHSVSPQTLFTEAQKKVIESITYCITRDMREVDFSHQQKIGVLSQYQP